jgi:hypothetical protein
VLAGVVGQGAVLACHSIPQIVAALTLTAFGRVLFNPSILALRSVQATNVAETTCIRIWAALASTGGVVHSSIAPVGTARHVLQKATVARSAIPGILALTATYISLRNTSILAHTRFCCITALTGVTSEWSWAITGTA